MNFAKKEKRSFGFPRLPFNGLSPMKGNITSNGNENTKNTKSLLNDGSNSLMGGRVSHYMVCKATPSIESTSNTKATIRRYMIVGERRFSNYWWTFVISLGSCGFLFTGISSYLGFSLPIFGENAISFFPQGLLMSFYGSLGLLLSVYWLFLIFWNVGGGFNEFNKKDQLIRVFRWGYPGKNRRIDLQYSLKDVEAIKVELKQGFDPQRTIFLKLKGKREIPLTGVGQPLTLKDLEKQASELANFLQVSLEGL